MFTRMKQSRDGEYLQIVANYRDGSRVRQRMVLYVGHYESIDKALQLMPRLLTQARRKATVAERDVAFMRENNYSGGMLKEEEERARKLRAEADGLGQKLDELRRLVADNPELLTLDAARAERHAERQQRRRAAVTKAWAEARAAKGASLVTTPREA
jgi:hypothetical protein